MILISVLFMCMVHPWLAGILFFWSALFVIVGFFLYQKTVPTAEKFSECKSVVFGKLVDCISNHSIVRFFSTHQFERTFLGTFLKQAQNMERRFRFELMVTWTKRSGIQRGQVRI